MREEKTMPKWWEKEKEKKGEPHETPFKPLTESPRHEIPPALEEPKATAPVIPNPSEKKEKNMAETVLKPSTFSSNSQHQTLLGGSMTLKGELTGNEDLTIEGQFDGTINLKDYCVTIGQNGQVKADVTARQVVVSGKLDGKINAREKIEIHRTGSVVGDLVSAGVAIEEGAYFKGSIEILRDEEKKAIPRAASSGVSYTA